MRIRGRGRRKKMDKGESRHKRDKTAARRRKRHQKLDKKKGKK